MAASYFKKGPMKTKLHSEDNSVGMPPQRNHETSQATLEARLKALELGMKAILRGLPKTEPAPAPAGAPSDLAVELLETVLTDLNILMGDGEDAPAIAYVAVTLALAIRQLRSPADKGIL